MKFVEHKLYFHIFFNQIAWKGKDCSLRHDECEVADCNGHGHCVSGKCQCIRGYKGAMCEEGKRCFDFVYVSILFSFSCSLVR